MRRKLPKAERQPVLTEHEGEVIEQFQRKRQNEKAEARRLDRAFEQSASEYRLLRALDKNPRGAIREKAHCQTVHQADAWTPTVEAVRRKIPEIGQRKKERIAEVLVAAKLWATSTIGLPDAITLERILKKDKAVHRKFARKSEKLIRHLEEYDTFLSQLPRPLFKVSKYETLHEFLVSLVIPSILKQIRDKPELHGTRLHGAAMQKPRNWAASEIIPLLRKTKAESRSGFTRDLALETCLSLLDIVGLVSQDELQDSLKRAATIGALWAACRRSRGRASR